MGSDTQIGAVTQFILQTVDPLGNHIDTKLNSRFLANQEATYSNVENAMRAVVELSKNTYFDTICITEISVGAIIAG